MVAFYFPGQLPIYFFTLLLGLGATFGLAWVARQASADKRRHYLDAGLSVLVGSLVGGRIAYVAVHWPYFRLHTIEIPQVNLGGFAWPGALLGGLLGLLVFASLSREPLGALADGLLPLAFILVLSIWLGCWLDGCAYGSTSNDWWAVPARGEGGEIAPRFPLQFVGALFALLTLWFIDRFRNRFRFPGQAALLGMCLLSLQLFVLTIFRADPAPIWSGLRLNAWVAIGISVITFALLVIISIQFSKKRPHNSIVEQGQ